MVARRSSRNVESTPSSSSPDLPPGSPSEFIPIDTVSDDPIRVFYQLTEAERTPTPEVERTPTPEVERTPTPEVERTPTPEAEETQGNSPHSAIPTIASPPGPASSNANRPHPRRTHPRILDEAQGPWTGSLRQIKYVENELHGGKLSYLRKDKKERLFTKLRLFRAIASSVEPERVSALIKSLSTHGTVPVEDDLTRTSLLNNEPLHPRIQFYLDNYNCRGPYRRPESAYVFMGVPGPSVIKPGPSVIKKRGRPVDDMKARDSEQPARKKTKLSRDRGELVGEWWSNLQPEPVQGFDSDWLHALADYDALCPPSDDSSRLARAVEEGAHAGVAN